MSAETARDHPHYPDTFPGSGAMKCLSCGKALTLVPMTEPCPGPEIKPLQAQETSRVIDTPN